MDFHLRCLYRYLRKGGEGRGGDVEKEELADDGGVARPAGAEERRLGHGAQCTNGDEFGTCP